MNNHEQVKAYLDTHPAATDREIADTLTISRSTVNKWRKHLKAAEDGYGEHREHNT